MFTLLQQNFNLPRSIKIHIFCFKEIHIYHQVCNVLSMTIITNIYWQLKCKVILITKYKADFGHRLRFTVVACCLGHQTEGARNLKKSNHIENRLYVIQRMDVTSQKQVDEDYPYFEPQRNLWPCNDFSLNILKNQSINQHSIKWFDYLYMQK